MLVKGMKKCLPIIPLTTIPLTSFWAFPESFGGGSPRWVLAPLR
jgi:hypothetical protein